VTGEVDVEKNEEDALNSVVLNEVKDLIAAGQSVRSSFRR